MNDYQRQETLRYRVSVPFLCFVTVEVEANSEEEAIDAGIQGAWINSYVGNGSANSLIGVSEGGISAADEPCTDLVPAVATLISETELR